MAGGSSPSKWRSSAICFLALTLRRTGLERAARWALLTAFALVAGSFIGFSVAFGFRVEYRFEVAAIAIIWLPLALVGVMLTFVFAGSFTLLLPKHR